jgi:vesicle transport protein SEC22
VAKKSDELLASSAVYEKNAKAINYNMFLRQYGPFIAVALFVILLIYIRFYWF